MLRRTERGFSVVELALILIILAITVVGVSFHREDTGTKLKLASEHCAQNLRYARNLAIKTHRHVIVTQTAANQYSLSYVDSNNISYPLNFPDGEVAATLAIGNFQPTSPTPTPLIVFNSAGSPYNLATNQLVTQPTTITIAAKHYRKQLSITPNTGTILIN